MDSAYFSGRSRGYLTFFAGKIFFGVQNLDPLYRPVPGKPLVLEVLCLEVDTSVASFGTAETVVETIKCMCDVDMRGRVRKFSGFSILATPTIEIFRFLDVGHPE